MVLRRVIVFIIDKKSSRRHRIRFAKACASLNDPKIYTPRDNNRKGKPDLELNINTNREEAAVKIINAAVDAATAHDRSKAHVCSAHH